MCTVRSRSVRVHDCLSLIPRRASSTDKDRREGVFFGWSMRGKSTRFGVYAPPSMPLRYSSWRRGAGPARRWTVLRVRQCTACRCSQRTRQSSPNTSSKESSRPFRRDLDMVALIVRGALPERCSSSAIHSGCGERGRCAQSDWQRRATARHRRQTCETTIQQNRWQSAPAMQRWPLVGGWSFA